MSDELEQISAKDIEFVDSFSGSENRVPETARPAPSEEKNEEEQVEQPKGEEGKETGVSSPDSPESSQSTPPSQPEEESKGLDELIQEASKGEYTSYKAIQDKMSALSGSLEKQKPDNELLEKFMDFRRDRTEDMRSTVKLFLETQLMEIDKLSDMDAIKAKMKMDNPNRSADDIDFLIHNRYKLDENEFESDEIRLAKLQLEDDGARARKELLAVQEKAALSPTDNAAEKAAREEEVKQANERWEKDVEGSMKDFSKISYQFGEEATPFSYQVENTKEIRQILSHLPVFWERYVTQNEDGTYTEHIDQLRNDLALLTNSESILKAVFDQGREAEKEAFLHQRGNSSTTDKEKNKEGLRAGEQGAKSELEEIAEGLGAQIR